LDPPARFRINGFVGLTPEDWDNGFRTQTGQNINVAANGIAKLLRMMIEEDD
jgi:hypothetical protein